MKTKWFSLKIVGQNSFQIPKVQGAFEFKAISPEFKAFALYPKVILAMYRMCLKTQKKNTNGNA